MTDTDTMVRAVWLITQLIHAGDPTHTDWTLFRPCFVCGARTGHPCRSRRAGGRHPRHPDRATLNQPHPGRPRQETP